MEKLVSVLGKHVIELSLGTGITLLTIVGPYYTLFAMVIRLFATALDILVGATKAKYVKKNYDSSVFGRSIMKRAFILFFGCLLIVICWHTASLIPGDYELYRIILGSIGTGYFHLFTLQELSSLSEHWKDIDPDSRGAGIVYKITHAFKRNIEEKIGSKLQPIIRVYDYFSPKLGKDYMRN